MSVDTCKCGKHVDTDFAPEFYREEFNHEGLCDSCYESRQEEMTAPDNVSETPTVISAMARALRLLRAMNNPVALELTNALADVTGLISELNAANARNKELEAKLATARDDALEKSATFADAYMIEQEGINYGIGTKIRSLKSSSGG